MNFALSLVCLEYPVQCSQIVILIQLQASLLESFPNRSVYALLVTLTVATWEANIAREWILIVVIPLQEEKLEVIRSGLPEHHGSDLVSGLVERNRQECFFQYLNHHYYDYSYQQFIILLLFQIMETEKEIQQYLNIYVNPVMSQMLVDIIKERPKNVLQFCRCWAQRKIEFHKTITQIDSDEDEENTIDDEIIKIRRRRPRAQQRRCGVMGQIYGSWNKNVDFEPKVIKKKGLVKNRILFRLKSTFMFNDLNEADYLILINAMEEVEVQPGAVIIREGESGEEVYILDEGELECFKNEDGDGDGPMLMKEIKEGEMFGELSMLYNIPRTANIRAKKRSILFKLDRKTFNFVLRKKNLAKRETYCSAIDKVDIFRELKQPERDKLEDILREMTVNSNQYVIREGRIGNKFYIVQKGQLVALKKNENGTENVVYQYHDGDYFGELSLLSNKARAASIMALTNSKLFYIQREAFERVIGPMEHILQRNQEIFSKYIKYTGLNK